MSAVLDSWKRDILNFPCICARCTVVAQDVKGTATQAGAQGAANGARKKVGTEGSMRVSLIEGMAMKAADAIGPAWDLSNAAWSSARAGKMVLAESRIDHPSVSVERGQFPLLQSWTTISHSGTRNQHQQGCRHN